MWTYVLSHWVDIAWEVAFAVFVGFLVWLGFETLPDHSRLRAWIRQIKNSRSRRSAARLRKRIAELESYVVILTSDKALYLGTLRVVIGILMFMALGAALTTLSGVVLNAGILSFGCYAAAVVVEIAWLRTLVALGTRDQAPAIIDKVKLEIAALRHTLNAM